MEKRMEKKKKKKQITKTSLIFIYIEIESKKELHSFFRSFDRVLHTILEEWETQSKLHS